MESMHNIIFIEAIPGEKPSYLPNCLINDAFFPPPKNVKRFFQLKCRIAAMNGLKNPLVEFKKPKPIFQYRGRS